MWFLMPGITFEYLLMRIAAVLVVVFVTLPFHEYAHALVARKLGDNTAEMFGALKFNPLFYFDPIGAACVLFFGFGWSRPAPVNPSNFSNLRRDTALVAAAGPISNFLSALVGGFLLNLAIACNLGNDWLYLFFAVFIKINLEIAVINLIPLMSLDGYAIFGSLMPRKLWAIYYPHQRTVEIILIVLLFFGILGAPINIIENLMYNFIIRITSLPFFMYKI